MPAPGEGVPLVRVPRNLPRRRTIGVMSDPTPVPIDRHAFDAAALLADHPPRVQNANKRVVLDIACPPGAVHLGTIGYTRWAPMELPGHLDPVPPALVLPMPAFFDYQPAIEGQDVVEWHVNFADPHLFVAYGSGLFAQDEMQVAEHPGLAALKQALEAADVETRTDGPDGPTPVLVTGVERRVSIETNRDAAAGRPQGLYGNAFASADPDAVRQATTRIDPPTVTNLIAIAAIAGGWVGVATRETRSTGPSSPRTRASARRSWSRSGRSPDRRGSWSTPATGAAARSAATAC